MEKSSALQGFHKLSIDQRVKLLRQVTDLSEDTIADLSGSATLSVEKANNLIENVIGISELPLGIATNFLINGKNYLIPMAIEEASVVAACSYGAKIARASGGFAAYSTESLMIGQIQVLGLTDINTASAKVVINKERILKMANERSKTLREHNAGARDIETRIIGVNEKMLVIHLIVDVMDAMGANVVNTMCEHVAPLIEEITGGYVNLRILSNLSIHRRSYATATFRSELIGGREVADRIIQAYNFADLDLFRAATHNKGIMNGIDAVLLATMNDWRAVEAGAHSFASIGGYHSLTKYRLAASGDIIGSIDIPIAIGTVGGSTTVSAKARAARSLLDIKDSREFAYVLACVGLAQNFSAIRALASEGIQAGHMKLHARNIALSVGAPDVLVDLIVERMMQVKDISHSSAKKILESLEKSNKY